MAYTPTTWTTGDTITASAMNKIENGIANAGGALICTVTNTGSAYALDKTVQEIYDALESGTPVFVTYTYGVPITDYASDKFFAPIIKIYTYESGEIIRIVATWTTQTSPTTGDGSYLHVPATAVFSANSMNDYPTFYRTVTVNGSSLTSVNALIY